MVLSYYSVVVIDFPARSTSMQQVAIRLDPKMLADLKRIADADDRTVAYIVRKFLSERLAEELPKLTKKK
jgi:predicted transcriptional regulator